MGMNEKTPMDVYRKIDSELLNIVASLNIASSDAVLNQAQKEARELFTLHQDELQKQLIELESNAEWKRFTIAFYGETGSGKSTIIETLRILLKEPSKIKSQNVFCELLEEYNLSEKNLQQLKQAVEQIDTKFNELEQHVVAIAQWYEQQKQTVQENISQAKKQYEERILRIRSDLQNYEQQHTSMLEAIQKIQDLIAERKRTTSLWKRVLNFFSKTLTPEEIELAQTQEKLSTITASCDNTEICLNQENNLIDQELLALESQLGNASIEREKMIAKVRGQQEKISIEKKNLYKQYEDVEGGMDELLAKMNQYADGGIIGDGRADFTRETQHYDLEWNNEKFSLLDVPGIEGKEGIVLGEIKKAVQKAHAVFYVTNQAAPPQTGDEQRKGTLEKIKEHLGVQTEVWTIFNKKITNPKYSLKNRDLLSNDESLSLNGLNEKMREQLGENYREVFSISALPAFLASTNHFPPKSKNTQSRKKIIEDFETNELIEKSRFRAFLQLLLKNIMPGSKAKIIRANLNKAKTVLEQTSAALADVQQTFSELSEKLAKDGERAKIQLNGSFKAMQQRLESSGESLISCFDSDVRNKIYKIIDADVSNDKFKEGLKEAINSHQELLLKKIPDAMKKEVDIFQYDVEDILKRFEEHARELVEIYAKLNNMRVSSDFSLNIQLDNGLKLTGLAAVAAGAALLWWNPAGWAMAGWVVAVSVGTLVVGAYKSVRGFFSSDYKKSQQRKSTEENLRKITKKFRESLRDSLENTLPEIQQKVSQLEQAVDIPSRQVIALVQSLQHSNNQLKVLSRKIDEEGRSYE